MFDRERRRRGGVSTVAADGSPTSTKPIDLFMDTEPIDVPQIPMLHAPLAVVLRPIVKEVMATAGPFWTATNPP